MYMMKPRSFVPAPANYGSRVMGDLHILSQENGEDIIEKAMAFSKFIE